MLLNACELQIYRHSFCPLIYLFSQQIESVEATRMAMVGMQIVAVHFFGSRLAPSVNISDHSNGLRSGMQYINIDHLAGPDEDEVKTLHMSDWAHIAWHYMKGRLLSKSNPYYGECYYYLKAIHFAHSSEMMDLLIQHTV